MSQASITTATPHTGSMIKFLYFCHTDCSTSTSSFLLLFFRRPFNLFSKASSSACCLRFSSSIAALASASFISDAFRFISLHNVSHSSETWPSCTLLHCNSFFILLHGHLSLTFWLQFWGQSPEWQISLHRWPQDNSFGHWFLQELRRSFSFKSAQVIFMHSIYRFVSLQWHFILSIWTHGGHWPGWQGKTHEWGQPGGRGLVHASSHWEHSGLAFCLSALPFTLVHLWHSFMQVWFWQSSSRPQNLLHE